jgi:putative oxidoreductase
MKKIDIALLIARVGIAALMLTHGIPKLMMLFSGAPIQFPAVFGMSAQFSLVLTVLVEVFGSIFLIAGLFTRLAVIPLIGTMLVAALLIHSADPLSAKEPALLYLTTYLVLFFAGAGKYSVDYLLQKRVVAVKPTRKEIEDPTLAIYQ